jgi:acetylornithine deacetylase/succinyl-diaminopimelate desuccinylase-like protein
MGKMPQFKGFEATCEASIIIEAMKTPTVTFGPGRIAQAHCADEYIEVEQIAKATSSYIELAKNFLTK